MHNKKKRFVLVAICCLYISHLKKINNEREAKRLTDNAILSNKHFQILTQKKKENIKYSYRCYRDLVILNRALECLKRVFVRSLVVKTTNATPRTHSQIIWASTQENLPSGVREQQRRRPAFASAQTDQRLCLSLIGKYHI